MSNQAEFLELYLSNEKGIRAFLHSLVRDPHEFDDVFQTIVMRLWEKFERYDPQRPFGPWARGVAAKEVLAMRRQQGRCPTPFSPELVTQILDSFEQNLIQTSDERKEALHQCLELLTDKPRQMLSLRYAESLSLADLAQRVGSTVAAAQRSLSRIRAGLGECIETRLAAMRKGIQ
jgi:RNA polymerase sigma-70 factor (ECF subfamily)